MKKMTLDELEKLVEQLPPEEQLKLVARIFERMSGINISISKESGTEKPGKKRVSKYLLEYP